ncbi:MAG: hypothetical protein ACHQ4G_05375 [Opitutales bacterium]
MEAIGHRKGKEHRDQEHDADAAQQVGQALPVPLAQAGLQIECAEGLAVRIAQRHQDHAAIQPKGAGEPVEVGDELARAQTDIAREQLVFRRINRRGIDLAVVRKQTRKRIGGDRCVDFQSRHQGRRRHLAGDFKPALQFVAELDRVVQIEPDKRQSQADSADQHDQQG